MNYLISLFFFLFIWVISLQTALAQDLKPVSFLPQWVPQAQFAGYYVAFEKGFYRDLNLEVMILKGGPDRAPSELLKAGQVDFATMFLTSGIANRAKGVKLVNIAQMVQRSALMLVAKKSSGIKAPEDLNGKKIGLWGPEFQILPRAFFQQYRLAVKTIPQGATINLFLRGGVDAASAMWYNEYHQIIAAGLNPEELTTFLLSDYGLKFPEDGIYCLEETLRRDPALCAAFVKASILGWEYSFSHPEEALEIVMKYINEARIATNRAHQRWMLARMRDIMKPPGSELKMGILRPDTYSQVAEELKKSGMIHEVPDFSRFHINCD
ncbi:MAG: ABC transporter substrate-binding protein [Desulfobacteraceae bacterium]|nr:MAG: ABC transporter substrate-binding protein [Desulfobacteraceae bacterium]